MQRWSAALLGILNVKLAVHGSPGEGKTLVVANHVSWLDVYLINAVMPVRFVAKAEVRTWPGIGWLVVKTGNLFIERGKRSDTVIINRTLSGLLAAGERVAFFPEGTSTRGDKLLPFHASLFQPAVETDADVQPVALRYLTEQNSPDPIPSYAGADTFTDSLKRILTARSVYAELVLLPTVAAGDDRRRLARTAESAIADALKVSCRDAKTRQGVAKPLPLEGGGLRRG